MKKLIWKPHALSLQHSATCLCLLLFITSQGIHFLPAEGSTPASVTCPGGTKTPVDQEEPAGNPSHPARATARACPLQAALLITDTASVTSLLTCRHKSYRSKSYHWEVAQLPDLNQIRHCSSCQPTFIFRLHLFYQAQKHNKTEITPKGMPQTLHCALCSLQALSEQCTHICSWVLRSSSPTGGHSYAKCCTSNGCLCK